MADLYPVISNNDNLPGAAIAPTEIDENHHSKISNDSYEVFVNDDKVGNKILLTQTDDAKDLNQYLEENGFNHFKVNVLGDSIVIETNERPHKMKEILSSYLDIR